MNCHITKDKTTGEEFLIPGCYGILNHWGTSKLTDRQIIKQYCCCQRKEKAGDEKYEIHTKDEVVAMIEVLEKKIQLQKELLLEMEEQLEVIKSEVFMLNTVTEF